MSNLVQPLFEGPIDIVGDVHGEIDAFQDLLDCLGHAVDVSHPEGRRLVFVGDLVDRGPNSPAVVEVVRRLIDAGRAQCVLGNHELNILLGDRKHDNHWFYGEPWSLAGEGQPVTPAVLANETTRQSIRRFFETLPLVLERDDVRVIHACWDDEMVEIARQSSDASDLYRRFRDQIETDHRKSDRSDEIERGLDHQNRNPVKVLTSGKERRVAVPFKASGKLRYEERVRWWDDYGADAPLCIFGHYAVPTGASSASGQATCVDFGVANRWKERTTPSFDGTFDFRLAAVRLPERVLMFDDGSEAAFPSHSPSS